MRTVFLTAALAAALCSYLPAQDEISRPGARVEELQQRLQLTDEQRDKIRPILEQEANRLRDIRAKYEGKTGRRDRLRLARELRDVQQDIEKKVNPILTKAQREEWKKLREERREQLREQVRG